MDAIIEGLPTTQASATHPLKSRPGALIWSLRKSRDRWKQKHQTLKAGVKACKNRVADLTRSRQHWKLLAQRAGERVAALEAQLATRPIPAVAEPPGKKTPAR